MKKTIFFFSTLPFLISSPGVSIATESLSGILSADALTSIKSLSLSLCPLPEANYFHLSLTNTALSTSNLTPHRVISCPEEASPEIT